MTPVRTIAIVSHPIQYQVPLFQELTRRGRIQLEVWFLGTHGIQASWDPGFAQRIQYDIPLTSGYRHQFARWRLFSSTENPFSYTSVGLKRLITPKSVLWIHGYGYPFMWPFMRDCHQMGVPILMRGESWATEEPTTNLRGYLRNLVLKRISQYWFGGLAIGSRNRAFYHQLKFSEDRVFSAPYSVDNKRFRCEPRDKWGPRRTSLLRGLGLKAELPTAIVVSKLQPWKRVGDVIEAVNRLEGKLNLLIVGDGPERKLLQARIRTRNIALVGFVNQNQLPRYYQASDIVILSSSHEPWGLALNEGMAAGAIPVCSSAVGAGPDLVSPSSGLIHEVGNVGQIAEQLEEAASLIHNTSVQATVNKVIGEFSIEKTAEGIERGVSAAANLGGPIL